MSNCKSIVLVKTVEMACLLQVDALCVGGKAVSGAAVLGREGGGQRGTMHKAG
jgi:hypothetical protein